MPRSDARRRRKKVAKARNLLRKLKVQRKVKVSATWTTAGELTWGSQGRPLPAIKMPQPKIGELTLG